MTDTVAVPQAPADAWVVITGDYEDYDGLTDARLAAPGVHTRAEANEIADGFSLEPIVVRASLVPHLVDRAGASQELLDAFVPGASVLDAAVDPAVEAKGRAVAFGVEDATGSALPAHLAPEGVSWVWVVVGGTQAHTYTAVVCADEHRAWDTARDLVRHSRGVRVERHPLL